MAMAVNQHDVKVKFIETQFISSDAASFKSVVQRLTGKHATPPAPPSSHAPAPPQQPRPCRPAFAAGDARSQQQQAAGYWAHDQYSGHGGQQHLIAPPKQEPPRMEELYELCDFSDMLYAATAAGARRDGGGFPY